MMKELFVEIYVLLEDHRNGWDGNYESIPVYFCWTEDEAKQWVALGDKRRRTYERVEFWGGGERQEKLC